MTLLFFGTINKPSFVFIIRQHFLSNVKYFKILSPEESYSFELWDVLDRTFTAVDLLSIDSTRKTLLCSALEGYASLSMYIHCFNKHIFTVS